MKNEKKAQSGNRKQITFDLSQKELEHHYPRPKGSKNPRFYKKAYADIMAFMKEDVFEHRQFSVYTSIGKMTNTDVVLLMDELAEKMPWLSPCVNQIDVTNIGTQHSLLEILASATQQQFDENVVEPPIKNDIADPSDQ